MPASLLPPSSLPTEILHRLSESTQTHSGLSDMRRLLARKNRGMPHVTLAWNTTDVERPDNDGQTARQQRENARTSCSHPGRKPLTLKAPFVRTQKATDEHTRITKMSAEQVNRWQLYVFAERTKTNLRKRHETVEHDQGGRQQIWIHGERLAGSACTDHRPAKTKRQTEKKTDHRRRYAFNTIKPEARVHVGKKTCKQLRKLRSRSRNPEAPPLCSSSAYRPLQEILNAQRTVHTPSHAPAKDAKTPHTSTVRSETNARVV